MRWNEVKRIYPDRFVLLQVLESHIEGDKKYIDDVAIIKTTAGNTTFLRGRGERFSRAGAPHPLA